MRAEMTCFAVVSEALCPLPQFSGSHEKLTGSGSEVDASLSRGAASLKASGPRRLAKRHHGRQETHTSIAEPYEKTRYEGDNLGSCFVAVAARTVAWAGLAGIGIRRRPEL